MSETTATDRAAQLRAELEEIERAEQAAAEDARRAAVAERTATLDPEKAAERERLESKANEALDREFPPTWAPHKPTNREQPRQIVGIVRHINPSVGPSAVYGTYSTVIEVETTEGDEWTVWAAHGNGALFQSLVRLRIQPGDVIAIRYRGKKQSTTSAFSYQDYRLVRVEGDEAEPEWVDYDQLQLEAAQPALPPAPEAEANPDDDGIPF